MIVYIVNQNLYDKDIKKINMSIMKIGPPNNTMAGLGTYFRFLDQ